MRLAVFPMVCALSLSVLRYTVANHLPDAHLLYAHAGHGQAGSWRKSDIIVHGDSLPLASWILGSILAQKSIAFSHL
jgi:hypothetical protein